MSLAIACQSRFLSICYGKATPVSSKNHAHLQPIGAQCADVFVPGDQYLVTERRVTKNSVWARADRDLYPASSG